MNDRWLRRSVEMQSGFPVLLSIANAAHTIERADPTKVGPVRCIVLVLSRIEPTLQLRVLE